jgi:signal transduction histidine kinase
MDNQTDSNFNDSLAADQNPEVIKSPDEIEDKNGNASNGEGFQQDSGLELQHLEGELRLTLEEIARLQNALAEANMKLMAVQSSPTSSSKEGSVEDLLRPVVKELRQPLVTIKGYIELLLNESVGTLGAFQRRFVERIQKAVEHMEESFDNINKSNNEEQSGRSLYSQSFSVRKSIEAALDLFITTIRSKEIVLKIDIPYEDIRLFEDKENFEQVLNLLLTNATLVLGSGGSLSINLQEYLTLQPQELVITIESCERSITPTDLVPVLPELYKNQSLTLPGFGLPLEDVIRAGELVKEMGGKNEVFSNSCGATVVKVRLPIVQGENLS